MSYTRGMQADLSALYKLAPTDVPALLRTSDALVASFKAQLQSSTQSMLPSYTHELPRGSECGKSVAVDLGGSTLRVAVIELQLKADPEGKDHRRSQTSALVLIRQSWLVTEAVKKLPSNLFFDWIAERIARVVEATGMPVSSIMSVGVTWSFPVEPTSAASGKVLKMGKGYEQWASIGGTDLKAHFEASFKRRGLQLRMLALMNDTEATLLSHAYVSPGTQISLIWGTGINAAMIVPVQAISARKLGKRPYSWTKVAKAVVVNTEISMSGLGIFPLTRADEILDRNGSHPAFQPLEQLTSGRYLGEISRLTILSLVQRREIFDGHVPAGMETPYSFETSLMSTLEDSDSHDHAFQTLAQVYSFQVRPSPQDMDFLKSICSRISERAAVYIAIALYSLYRVQRDFGQSELSPISESTTPVAIAYCGAVAEKHPTARHHCQRVLDLLTKHDGQRRTQKVVLEAADDSGLLGAAVGAVMNEKFLTLGPKL